MPKSLSVPFITSRPLAEIEEERRKIQQWFVELRRHPESARAFLVKHGFITKTGKVGKRYR